MGLVMTKPVYLESWSPDEFGDVYKDRPELTPPEQWIGHFGDAVGVVRDDDVARARLAAAAPAMVRALLSVELDGDGMLACCRGRYTEHAYDCDLDTVLSAAGFPDQASRDEARQMIRGAR